MTELNDQQESTRLLEINRYQVLDSEPEQAFDRVTKLASEFFETPVAAISLCDQERLWFKSIVGLDILEMPRSAGICSQVIYNDTPLVLHSASDHPEFHDHPMVADAPHVRFYAGAPLVTPSGERIGSLCVADVDARPGFTCEEAGRLKDLASLVVDELELRLERMNAIRASDAKSAFLAAMSHEIRTPMNGVLGMTDLLLATDDLGERQRRRVEVIQRSGRTLLTLLDQILDLSKIEAEKLEVTKEPFDLRSLIQDLHVLFQARAQEQQLWFDLMDRLGAVPPLQGDHLRIRQILSNFLNNAIKFTREGGVALRASALRKPNGLVGVRVEVQDTGIGIGPESIDRVFAPFEQADASTCNQFGGTGLGLAICKRLASIMGGDVGAESTPGQGSTFWLQLELETAEKQDDADDAAPARGGDHGSRPSSIAATPDPARAATGGTARTAHKNACGQVRILVAEDEPVNAFLVEEMLDAGGYASTVVHDGKSVLAALEKETFDLILMDSRMPDMNGLEVARRIRQLSDTRASTPIIALTADAMSGDRERFLAGGMNDYVSKPVDHAVLFEAIGRCLEQARSAAVA
ncbi:MAG: ATP-binding protein [Alphaproteobacteria bacterium]|nr:ATP-binding protein [Alphaproteobacteria bacterium]